MSRVDGFNARKSPVAPSFQAYDPISILPSMILRRLVQLVALLMIGDGVSGLLKPRWHSLLWNIGPDAFQTMMVKLAANPTKARLLYAAEFLSGPGYPPV